MLDYLDYGASLGLFIYLFSKDALNWSYTYIYIYIYSIYYDIMISTKYYTA